MQNHQSKAIQQT